MKTKTYKDACLVFVRYSFVCLFFALLFFSQARGQNPLLEDADKITPWGNCDLVPTIINPKYKLIVNNISVEKSAIASYRINWGDNPTDEILTGDFSSKEHTYTSLGLFNLVITAISKDGVSTSKSYSVSNQSNPAVGLSNNDGNTIGCSPLALSFTITGTANNAPGTTYEIDYGDGSVKVFMTIEELIVANNLIKHTYTKSSCDAPGVNGQFTLKVKAINSCTSTPASVGSIIVYKSPIPKFSTSFNNNGCINASILFTNQTISGSGYNCNSNSDIYRWEFGDGGTSTDKNPVHTYIATGIYQVSLTSSNGQCGSMITTPTLPICINPKPTASFTLDKDKVCKGSSVTATNGSTTENLCGNLVYTWKVDNYVGSPECRPNASSWQFSIGSGKNSVNPSFIFDNAGSYRINLTVSNGCGSIFTSKTVTVKQIPSTSINPVNAICTNQTISPTALVYDCFAETLSTYSWHFAGGEPSTSSMKDAGLITYKNAGSYDILLSATNECGESKALPIKIQVNDYPIPVISGPTTVCANSKGNVYTTAPGMTNYKWSVSEGGVINPSNTSTSNSITVDWKTTDNQTVSLTYTQFECPAQSASVINVKVNPLPEAPTGKAVTICSADPVQIGAAAKVGSSYRWVSVPAGFVSNASAPTVNPLTTTEYFLTETTISTGCSASNSVIITVNPLPVLLVMGPAAVCVGSADVIYTAKAGMTNYAWSVSSGGIITAGGTSTSNTISISWNQEGNQSISLNYTNETGCRATIPLVYNVAVNTFQTVLIEGSSSVCEQSSGILYTALSGMTDYKWIISSDGTLISGGDTGSNTAEIKWNQQGAQSVSINYTQPGCQTATPAVIDVTVNSRPSPTIKGTNVVCENSKNVIYTTEGGMLNYYWEISSGGTITTGNQTNQIRVDWNTSGEQLISVNYENASGCSSLVPADYTVTVNQLHMPTIQGTLTLCQGLSPVRYTTEPAMSSYLWKVTSGGTIVEGSETNTISVVWEKPGVQSVSIRYINSTGCSSTDLVEIPVMVNPSPLVSVFPLIQEICSGTVASIKLTPSDGTVTYTWSAETISGTVTGAMSGDGPMISQQLVNTETSIAVVRYTIIPSNGTCSGIPVHADVKVRNLHPTIVGPGNSCVKTKGIIYWTEPGMTQYNWIVSSGGSITGGEGTNSITVDWNIAGDQTVSVSYSNIAGCTGNSGAVYNVKIFRLPSVTLASPTVVCAGSPVTFTTETGMLNYQWDADQATTVVGGTLTSNSMTVLWNNPGAYNLSLNYANSDLCSASAPLISEIIVLPVPLPIISGPQSVCENSGGILYRTQAGKVNYTWIIMGGHITLGGKSISSSATVVWDNIGEHSIAVNYSNGECSAPSPAVLKVNVNSAPTFTISSISGCTPLTVTLKNTSVSGAENYTWDFNDGEKYTTKSAIAEVTHTFSNELAVTKTYVVKLTSSSESGCTLSSEQTIKVEPQYSVGYPISQKGCSPYEVKFANARTGSKSVTWVDQDGLVLSTDVNPTLNFIAKDGRQTTYSVKLIGESVNGCISIVDNTITVFPQPKAAFTQSFSEGCSPLTVKFSNSSNGAITYQWDFGDGGASATLTDPDYTFISAGANAQQYDINLIVRNEYGCQDSYKSVVKLLASPEADFTADPLQQTLPSGKVQLTNLTKSGPWSYTWQFGDKTSPQTGNVSEYEYTKAGYYTISLTAKGDVCTSTKKIGITINEGAPGTDFDCETEGCAPYSVKFDNYSVNGFKFMWDFGNGNHSTEFEPEITYFEGGTYKVRLEVYNNLGEMTYSEKLITVHDKPNAFFRASAFKVRIPGSNVYFVNLSENAFTLLWDFGDGTTSTEFEPVHEYTKTGVYKVALKINTAFNCTDQFVLSPDIEIYSDEINLANAFIPAKEGPSGGIYVTGDPRNHIFHPNLVSGDIVEYELQIFNRWGNLVFQSREVERGWDGYFNGRLCQQDVYVWKIKCRFNNGEQIIKVGDVTLIQ